MKPDNGGLARAKGGVVKVHCGVILGLETLGTDILGIQNNAFLLNSYYFHSYRPSMKNMQYF
jgi:hypothetical protein